MRDWKGLLEAAWFRVLLYGMIPSTPQACRARLSTSGPLPSLALYLFIGPSVCAGPEATQNMGHGWPHCGEKHNPCKTDLVPLSAYLMSA